MQQYAIVFFPKGDLEKIQNFRRKYDPQYKIIAPHITLVSPFSNIPQDQIIQHIDKITKEVATFQISLTGLSKSNDHYLFLLVSEGVERINDLYDRLYSGILSTKKKNDVLFVPHITLGAFGKNDKLDEKKYKEACTEVEKMNIDIYCDFNNISLIKGDGHTPAYICKTFSLN